MTEAEIQNNYNQTIEDNIALDYTKWSAQQRERKQSTDHGLWQRERDAVLDRWQRDNESLRNDRLAKMKKEHDEREAARIEAMLAPDKKRLQNEWLANNPSQTAADFETKAWGLLHENLLAKHGQDALEAELAAQAASGRYSL